MLALAGQFQRLALGARIFKMARLRIIKATTRPDTRLQTNPAVYNVLSSLLAGGDHTRFVRRRFIEKIKSFDIVLG